jgi:predicted aspartyl protease
MISEYFRVKKPTLVIIETGGKKTMARIDTGTTVVLVNGILDAAGLVTVKWNNQTVLMFDTDLRERAELIGIASAAA